MSILYKYVQITLIISVGTRLGKRSLLFIENIMYFLLLLK